MTKFVYDETVTVSYGLYVCPECQARFYGGGRTLHTDGCSLLPNTLDYGGLELHFGPSQVQSAKECASRYDNDRFLWYGVCVAMLREQFPELL